MNRSEVIAAAKHLGLPLTGATDAIARLILIVSKNPATWTEEEFLAIAPHLSIHQDSRPGSEGRVRDILQNGLRSGMVDSVDNMLTGRWTWAHKLLSGDAYLFLSRKLKYKGSSAYLAPGNIPLYHFKARNGQNLYEAITHRGPATANPLSRRARRRTIRRMRNPATRIPFGGVLHGIPRPAEPRHITGLRSMKHLTWCCRCLGFDIYMVDGAKVAAQWADFVGGGHHLAYKFIPKRDIWIDKRVKEWPGFLAAHELLEALLMNVRGWSYERAHAAGNQIEQALRVTSETLGGDRLQAALAPTWRYNLALYFPGLEAERLDEMAEQAARQFWKYL